MKIFVFGFIFLFMIYLFFCGVLFFLQDKFIFFPEKYLHATPEAVGLKYQDIHLVTADNVRLHGWYVPHPDGNDHLIFFHGNAGNMADRLQTLALYHQLGLSVLIIDYRSYGMSEGTISETGIYLDGQAAWDYLTREQGIDPCKIIIHGRSLGGAVAIQTAMDNAPAGLILESAFISVPELAKNIYPFFPVTLIARYQFDNKLKIPEIQCPKLIIHSKDDEIIPFRHGKTLFNTAMQPKKFYELTGSHNEGFVLNTEQYKNHLRTFILGL